jgi:transposase
MRQTHVAGEKLFVDYAGDTVAVFDGATGEERHAHVFVAVLGASNYTYAEARWSARTSGWSRVCGSLPCARRPSWRTSI